MPASATQSFSRGFSRAMAGASFIALSVAAQSQEMEDVVIEAVPVTEGIYMLTGRGGNIGLSVGDDATIIVDDQYAPLTDKIVAVIGEITDRPVDYVLNTHWHGDHSGGNENFGKAGALIMAHDHVHTRMESGRSEGPGRIVPPSPPAALPVVTFNDALTLHVNGQTITGTHVAHAHTDGDTIVFFREANVLHMGDTYFRGMYPFIDLNSGGNVNGMINAAERALALGDENTRIIPGHGPLASKADLRWYRNMLVTVRDRVAAMMADGKSLEDIQAAKPTADFDGSVNADGFIKPDRLVGFVYDSLKG